MAEHALDAVAIPVAAKVASNRLTTIGFGFDDGDRHQGIDSAIIGCWRSMDYFDFSISVH